MENKLKKFPLFIFRIYSYLRPTHVNKIFNENQEFITGYNNIWGCEDHNSWEGTPVVTVTPVILIG
ncbi:hypothetical protein DESC_720200 [Desulfosarcina cetonica]|nr:hypothetical protein DESC_720200 [Desulfosarcina cetonica]